MDETALPKRFHLLRHKDVSGVSGEGTIAEGVAWSSGAVALHWPGHPQATSLWANMRDVLHAHGHNGLTEIVWIDESPDTSSVAPAQPKQPLRDGRGWPVSEPKC